MVPVGESRLELLEPTSETSTIAKFIAKRGEGLHHVCMKVPDLRQAGERLKRDGVRLVSEEIKTGAGGHQYVFVHPSSTGGVLLELVQAGVLDPGFLRPSSITSVKAGEHAASRHGHLGQGRLRGTGPRRRRGATG